MVEAALKPVLLPVLAAQALALRRKALVLPEAAGAREGSVGDDEGGTPLRLLIVGDSSAAGVGVATQEQAFAGQLTRHLAGLARRRVHWALQAKSGVSTARALELLRQARPGAHELAVAVLGVNDVIEQVPPSRAVAQRAALADWLREHVGVRHVIFTPLPPIDQFPLLPQPLRWIAGADARAHDRALARWAATRADVHHVPIVVQLGVHNMAADGFHPGEPVYRVCGETVAEFIARHLIPPETRP